LLTYFRVNDPFRVIGAFVLLMLTRLPYLISGAPLTTLELHWMLLGEKVAMGSSLYTEVWTHTGPLPALIFGLVELLFNRNPVVYVILSMLLITYQSLVFNNFLLTKKAYDENTYVPALVYIIISSFSFEFYFLSPVLISLTWILLAMRNVFYRVESRSRDNRILGTGIYLGLAALCYLPSLMFLLSTITAYLLFTNVSFRRYLLLLYGTALPLLLVCTYFFMTDGLDALVEQYVMPVYEPGTIAYVKPLGLLYLSGIALIFLLTAAYKMGQRRFTNQQTKLQQIMLIKILATLASLFFVRDLSSSYLWPSVPPLAFFISHYLLAIRRTVLAELITLLLFALVTLNGYAFLFGFFSLDQVYKTTALMVQETKYDSLVEGKRILVMGNQPSIYRNALPATPYLDWPLASQQLKEINYFSNLTEVYTSFSREMPAIIIDLQNLMPGLQDKIPLLDQAYQLKTGSEEVYLLRGGAPED